MAGKQDGFSRRVKVSVATSESYLEGRFPTPVVGHTCQDPRVRAKGFVDDQSMSAGLVDNVHHVPLVLEEALPRHNIATKQALKGFFCHQPPNLQTAKLEILNQRYLSTDYPRCKKYHPSFLLTFLRSEVTQTQTSFKLLLPNYTRTTIMSLAFHSFLLLGQKWLRRYFL